MGNCTGKAKTFNELNSSVLDRVTSRTSSEDDCLLYRLADYQRGGELVNFFQKEGNRPTEELLREQIPLLLYNQGEGRNVTRSDYLKWKYRNKPHVAVPINESTPNWKDHLACWNFEFRGSLGETLLHVLIVCDSKRHTKLAKMLIKCFPKMALDIVEGDEFRGASGLHLAIAYNNMELVKELVESGASITQRATGSFFLPRDLQKTPPAKQTTYEGLAYFGEFPLAWAACCGNESAYNLLVDRGADPNSQDALGNMVLHMVVVCDKLEMYGYALRHPQLPAKMALTNAAGLTPLTLACHLGRATIFREMLELTAREFWRYSNITCSAYPLNALDTILPDGRSNWNSALMIILNGTKEEHLDMLDGGIIQRLLEEKWKTFARNQFLKRLGIQFFYLFVLSMAVYMRPPSNQPLLINSFDQLNLVTISRFIFEAITLINCLMYLLVQQLGELRNQGVGGFVRQLASDPAKAIFLISNILTLACVPCRLAGDRSTEDSILIFSLPCAWFFLMFFAGAIRLTGPFVTMIYSMVTGDMMTFAIIYTVFLLGFSQAIFYLHKGHPDVPVSFENYLSTWMGLFHWTLGTYNFDALGQTPHPALTTSVFVIFMIMVPILLLNMLIAMMGNTYAQVIQQSEKEFVKQWAKIVVSLERSVKQEDAKSYLEEYSIKLPSVGGDGEDGDASAAPAVAVRGVMVIKRKSKTRARQRKGALGNWKRVGKFTITYLKKRGISGDALRMEIWHPHSATNSVNHSPSHALLATQLIVGYGDEAMDAFASLTNQTKMSMPAPAGPPPLKSSDAFGGMSTMMDQLTFASDVGSPKTTEASTPKTSTTQVPAASTTPAAPAAVVHTQQAPEVVSTAPVATSASGHATAPVAVVPPQKSISNPSAPDNVNPVATPVPDSTAALPTATTHPAVRTVTRSTSMDRKQTAVRRQDSNSDQPSALSDTENEIIARTLLDVHNRSASSSVDMEADDHHRHRCQHHLAASQRDDHRDRHHRHKHDKRDRDERRRDDRSRDRDDRKHDRHRDDRSREGRDRGDRSRSDDRGRDERRRRDRSREDRNREDRSREDRSREDRSREDRSREDRSRDDRDTYDRDDRRRDDRKRDKRRHDRHGRDDREDRDARDDRKRDYDRRGEDETPSRDGKRRDDRSSEKRRDDSHSRDDRRQVERREEDRGREDDHHERAQVKVQDDSRSREDRRRDERDAGNQRSDESHSRDENKSSAEVKNSDAGRDKGERHDAGHGKSQSDDTDRQKGESDDAQSGRGERDDAERGERESDDPIRHKAESTDSESDGSDGVDSGRVNDERDDAENSTTCSAEPNVENEESLAKKDTRFESEKKHGFSIQRMVEQRRGSCPSYLDEAGHSDAEPSGVHPGAPTGHQPAVKGNNKPTNRMGRRTNVISPMETKTKSQDQPPVRLCDQPAVIENNMYNSGRNHNGKLRADQSLVHESENESVVSDASSNSSVHETLFTAVTVPHKRAPSKMISSSSCESDAPIYHISGNMKSSKDSAGKGNRKESRSSNGSQPPAGNLNRLPSLSANGKSSRHPAKSVDKGDPDGKHGKVRPLTSTNTRINQAKANHFKAPREQVSVIAWEDNEDPEEDDRPEEAQD